MHLQSSPAWTQRKGQPAETIRATKAAGCAPGPGYYAPETKVEKRRHKVCRNAGQFSLIFSRIVTSPPSMSRCKSETASACDLGCRKRVPPSGSLCLIKPFASYRWIWTSRDPVVLSEFARECEFDVRYIHVYWYVMPVQIS